MAREHGLSGLAAVAMHAGRLTLPEDASCGIREDWAAAMRRSFALDRVCGVVGRLAQEGRSALSPPILLKGPAVAQRYRNPSLRPYVDVDLLVPAREVRAWSEALGQAGYWAPSPDIRIVERRYSEGCAFTHRLEGHQVDLHTSLFVERTARELGYEVLAETAEASCFPGILQTALPVQLVVLALHLAHHAADGHRLIWRRDFIELGESGAVERARRFAEEHRVGWALEAALDSAQRLVGCRTWDAHPSAATAFGLASAHRAGRTEYLRHLAVFRDLGAVAGLDLLASRLDPRRFVVPGTGFDRSAARSWLRRTARRARYTPWSRLWRPRS
jgi:hypothetical protein